MNDSYETDRRLFLTQLCAVAATAALIGSTLKAETPAAGTQEDAPNTHNMLVVGTEAVFPLISRCSMVSMRRKAIIHLRTGIR